MISSRWNIWFVFWPVTVVACDGLFSIIIKHVDAKFSIVIVYCIRTRQPEVFVDGSGEGVDPAVDKHLPRQLGLVKVEDAASQEDE